MKSKKDELRTYLHLQQLLEDMIQDFGSDTTLSLIEIAVEEAFKAQQQNHIKLVSTN